MISKFDTLKYHDSEGKCSRFSVLFCKCRVFDLPCEFCICSSDNVTVARSSSIAKRAERKVL